MATGFTTANLESSLHEQITVEAARNKTSFSKQIREYMNRNIKLEEQLVDAMSEIKALKEGSWPKKAMERRK